MFEPLPTPREMNAWDKAAAALGLPELVLMEHAGRAAVRVLAATYGSTAGKRVLVLMGAGNNGGDAACVARGLHEAGAQVLLLHTRPEAHFTGAAGLELLLAKRCGVPCRAWNDADPAASRFDAEEDLPGLQRVPDVIIDGLLGTGFSGQLRAPEAWWVRTINALAAQAFVLALDIPSGLDGLRGLPCPDAVRAHVTATFAAAKPGLVVPEAAPFVGALHVCDIGMPQVVQRAHPPSFQRITAAVLAHIPPPDPLGHKGRTGHVVIVGGSSGLCGAPHLAALGAMRAGAGLVTVAAPLPLHADIRASNPHIMMLDLGTAWDAHCAATAAPLLQRAHALVCGPGLGRTPAAAHAVAALASLPQRPPMVWDADALMAMATHPPMAAMVRPHDVLTPHPGEAAALLHISVNAVQADRPAALRALQMLAGGLWILKGAGTLLGRAGEPVCICPVAAPHLAVGGAGDVLAGCVAALLAQGMDTLTAACAAVWLHAQAGLLLASAFPHRGNTATDIADALTRVSFDTPSPA